ncbi:thiamine pyrophosphate-dependent enzyme [Xanthobacteraceae bacterium Astr-EGSB]|uniref:alpha-ketoacid dehydrogenase subunit alpha/beta n=1 Tax=Astrobacterium formosum TaxID=3069710 RepID=UPI0027AED1CD|nr:thiamine pyrophosphate-dependent enzyme [Xanthobacteraceae bacterium Astr-EGSB]
MPRIVDLKKNVDPSLDQPWHQIESTPKDWDDIGRQELHRMLSCLHLIRTFEETLLQLESEGLVHGPVHSSIGHEGAAVGSVGALRSSDLLTGSHRGHHHFLVKGIGYLTGGTFDIAGDSLSEEIKTFLYRSMAEIMGLSPGFGGGRGGSMHLQWIESGAYGTNAIVGGGVPLAAGLAWSKKREGQDDVVFTFLGDGSANIGSVPETMNLASLWRLPLCFFIENNGYAVATALSEATHEMRLSARGQAFGIPAFRVDGMDPVAVRLATRMALDTMRAGNGPALIEAMVYRYFHHSGGLPGSAFGYRRKDEEQEWRQRDSSSRVAAELIDRKWLSQDENEQIRSAFEQVMQDAAGRLTEKDGNKRRVIPAMWPSTEFCDQGVRGDLSEMNGLRYEEVETASGPVEEVKFIDVVSRVMDRRMEQDERIVLFGEDIHRLKGGTNGATRGLFDRYPGRVIPTPISEQAFAGVGCGLAMRGKYRPVVEFMYPDFSLVAADQVFNQIAKARHMFGGKNGVPLVLRTKCAIGTGYGSQHSMEPAGLYAMWPGWRIVAPSTPFDYVGLMNSALQCEDPVLVIEHVALYGASGPGPTQDFDYFIPLGKAKVVRPGNRITVLTYLAMTPLAVQAADELGLDVEVIDLRSLDRAGLDWATIEASVRKTNNVVVLEQSGLTVSYGAMLTDEVQRRCFDWLDSPVQRIHGGEASPTVSKILERAAFVGLEEIRGGLLKAAHEAGLKPAAE